jgi:hypothetical protein
MNQNRKPTYDSEKYILIYFPNHLLLYSLLYMSWYGVHTMHDSGGLQLKARNDEWVGARPSVGSTVLLWT